MLLLALDTSTSAITAAVHDGNAVLAEATTIDPRAHGERLAPNIATVLAEAGVRPDDLTDVVVGLGPGPFTGLRVGIVTARVMALATGAALHGVCSFDALAYAARGAASADGALVVATDARRKEVYWARYAVHDGQVRAVTQPQVCRPADLPGELRSLPAVGRGPLIYPDSFDHPVDGILDVSAAALADLAVRRLAAGESLSGTTPLYLRRPDAAPHVVAKSALG